MEIGVENTTFYAIDKTPYERWIGEGVLDNNYPHVIIQRLIKITDGEENRLITFNSRIASTPDELRNAWSVFSMTDGLYYYQKLLIPVEGHTTPSNDFIWYNTDEEKVVYQDSDSGKVFIFDPNEDFDDIYEIVRKESLDNCFYFDDYTFTIYSLVECYILSERSRINAYLQNNCKASCNSNDDLGVKTDILLAAVTVLTMLIEKKDYFEALRIFNGLSSCHNLCSNFYEDSINKCGCGTA